jgi:hypothetical protein
VIEIFCGYIQSKLLEEQLHVLIPGMEMSAADKRAHIAMLQCLGWTVGVCLMPMVAWATGDWVTFLIITSAPCAVFFLAYKLVATQPK